ncbi:thioredoxin family protein [Candidatus Poribacteria bacterium]|nr:thioredoxin family protein [Candidatus Poribacteria bacterium]
MKIQVLGTGCPKCKKVFKNAEKAVEISGSNAEIVKVEDVNKIMDYGVMITPALAIEGDVKISGKVPSPEQIAGWINEKS